MKNETAKRIASNWHGGQWSALYSFASSGQLDVETSLIIVEEVTQEILQPELALRPFFRSKKEQNELIKLRQFFIDYFKKEYATDIRIGKDYYGNEMPFLYGTNHNVRSIKRLQ